MAEFFQLKLESHQNTDQNSQIHSTKVAKIFTPNDRVISQSKQSHFAQHNALKKGPGIPAV